jgi:hypothetical protein
MAGYTHHFATTGEVEPALRDERKNVNEWAQKMHRDEAVASETDMNLIRRIYCEKASLYAETARIHAAVPDENDQPFAEERQAEYKAYNRLRDAVPDADDVVNRINDEPVSWDEYERAARERFEASNQWREAREALYAASTPPVGDYDFDAMRLNSLDPADRPKGEVAFAQQWAENLIEGTGSLDQARDHLIEVCQWDRYPEALDALSGSGMRAHAHIVEQAVETFNAKFDQANGVEVSHETGLDRGRGQEDISAEEVAELRSVVAHDFPSAQPAYGQLGPEYGSDSSPGTYPRNDLDEDVQR